MGVTNTFFIFLVCQSGVLAAAYGGELFSRGYPLLPEPQQVTITRDKVAVSPRWHLETPFGLGAETSILEVLKEGLRERHHIEADPEFSKGPVLRLELMRGSVTPGASQDSDKEAVAAQAYRISLTQAAVTITANREQGLFYGVQTFLQLLKEDPNGNAIMPEGEVTDWPDLSIRHIYWDCAHHLETLAELKRAIRQASFFKINGFVIKMEGHFEYSSAAPIVEPQALSPEQLRELTAYGLQYWVQVIPYLDAPAHVAFILKHPEYQNLRAFADSNYEMCMTNPEAEKLLWGMFDDLLKANTGVRFFYLSTDEPYYSGLSSQNGCTERERAAQLGSSGKVLAEFISKMAGYLHDRGRDVVFWGEYPLKANDIASLPSFLINGETYGAKFDTAYKAHGIRQMIYASVEGEEKLFPHYYLRPGTVRLHQMDEDYERIATALWQITADPARQNSDLTGLVVAGWGDMGLHPETFWLGYASVAAAGWKAWSGGASQATGSFYPLFYGRGAQSMDRIYQLLSYQAQTWSDTWETVDSHARKPIWGNSEGIFKVGRPAHDQTLRLPRSPQSNLRYAEGWSAAHRALLKTAAESVPENVELKGLLTANLLSVSENRYNLEVFLSISDLCRQNLDFIMGLGQIDQELRAADAAARAGKPQSAVEHVDKSLAIAQSLLKQRELVFRTTTAIWQKSWLPRTVEANGRKFLHEVDDVKDHLPDRTTDMSYLMLRETQLPFQNWFRQTQQARNDYAATHHLRPTAPAFLLW